MPGHRACPSCGAELSPAAHFCRACGAAVEATEAAPAPAPVPDPSPAADPDPTPAPDLGRGPAADPAPRSRGPLLALLAFAVCLPIAGAITGAAYLLSRDDPGDGAAVGTHTGPIEGGPTSGNAGGGGGTAETDPVDDGGGPGGAFSPLTPGRYIQAGSFRTPEGAQREVVRLLGEGIDADAVPADWASELLPGFQVLLVGPLVAGSEERSVLRQLEDAGVAGFARDLTPSEELQAPASVAGAWSGILEQSSLRGARPPTAYQVDFTLSADGETGAVDYPGRGCSGSLSLFEESGFSLAYAESIEFGGCRAGGIWHLRPEGGEITAVRLYDDLDAQVLVEGRAASVEG